MSAASARAHQLAAKHIKKAKDNRYFYEKGCASFAHRLGSRPCATSSKAARGASKVYVRILTEARQTAGLAAVAQVRLPDYRLAMDLLILARQLKLRALRHILHVGCSNATSPVVGCGHRQVKVIFERLRKNERKSS